MSAIERMTRYGRVYRVTLDCSHTVERTKDQIRLQQLYIGKRLGCEICARQQGKEVPIQQ